MNISDSKRKKALVLAVDDDPMLLEIHTDFLTELGCDTVTTGLGKEALEIAANSKPDLILLDMMMPTMSGLECLKLLKQDPAAKQIPVIMVTGEMKFSDIEMAFALGALDYIVKPAERAHFNMKVKTVLSPLGYTLLD